MTRTTCEMLWELGYVDNPMPMYYENQNQAVIT